ncbi:MAG: integrase core domain-containing protein [Actinomycetota bacterium]
MLLSLVYLMVRVLLRVLVPDGHGEARKDLEIVVLRHQMNVLRRQVKRPRFRVSDRAFLAAAAGRLPRARWHRFLVTPKTLLRWHRELVRLKWARYGNRPGRPSLPAGLQELILRFAKENPRWGYKRIQGELQKLGIEVSATAIRKLLARRGLGPAPRGGGTTWRQFLAQQASSMVACDFFTVETVWLKRIYVLVFIELATRRVHLAGCTSNPDGAWIVQQARNFTFHFDEREEQLRFLIHDRDAKFCGPFDEVFATEGLQVVRTPVRAPRANAFCERWIRTARTECLDWLLIFSDSHLERVLKIYLDHYNRQRPHRALQLNVPAREELERPPLPVDARVRRRDRLGGLLHEYYEAAA